MIVLEKDLWNRIIDVLVKAENLSTEGAKEVLEDIEKNPPQDVPKLTKGTRIGYLGMDLV